MSQLTKREIAKYYFDQNSIYKNGQYFGSITLLGDGIILVMRIDGKKMICNVDTSITDRIKELREKHTSHDERTRTGLPQKA